MYTTGDLIMSRCSSSHLRQSGFSLPLMLAGILLLFSCDVSGGAKTATADKTKESVSAQKPVFKQGHFVLMFSGNWSGSLGPCGCAEKMLGGLDRRSAILNAIPAPSRLLLDTGRLIEKSGLQAQFKLETFLLGLKRLRYDAIGLTAQELAMKEALGLSSDEVPMVIATGVTSDAQKKFKTVPSFEKTLQLDGHKRRCLVLSAGPIDAIRQTLITEKFDPNKPSEKCLIIVLMASNSEQQLEALRQIPAIDLVVMSGPTDQPKCIKESQSHLTVVTTGHLGKYIAAIELPVDPNAHGDRINFQAIAVEEHFAKDPKIVELFDALLYRLEIEDLVADEDKLARHPLDEDNFFVGSDTCKRCHEVAYEKWQDVPHSHAMQTLIKVGRHVDPECVRCHSVGMEYESGYRSMAKTPEMAGVGCEMCHGPGENHIGDTDKPFKMTFKSCVDCHDPENDPHFAEDYQKKFQKIKHWKSTYRSAWHP
jgi:hypothetical protein